MPQIPTLRLGTRGSRLALAQARLVQTALAPHAACEIVTVKTTGDRVTDRPLAQAGGKGLFVKELEEALLRGDIDLAVHSMKDMPPDPAAGLSVAACLPREDPRDAFLSLSAATLSALPKGARVGTSSVRRQAQVRRARPDLEVVPLRGNVDTRLRKLEEGQYDAMLLALAGLKRLGLSHRARQILSAEEWLPALAQGAIGIEVRKNDRRTNEAAGRINDEKTAVAIACERGFSASLGGSCASAMGGLATFADGILSFTGEVLAPDGSDAVKAQFVERLSDRALADAERLGREAGRSIRPRVLRWLDG